MRAGTKTKSLEVILMLVEADTADPVIVCNFAKITQIPILI